MPVYLAVMLCIFVFLAPGCGAKNQADKDNIDMRANLEPELWDARILEDIKRGRPLTEQEKNALTSRGEIQFDLDVRETEEVQMFLQYFSMEKRGTMERWLVRAEPHLAYVRAVLLSFNLPPDLIALPFIESGYNSMAYSHAGAGGMWQFMPYTGKRFGLTVDWWEDERRNPYKATVAAAKYLTVLHEMFGDWHLALAAYNAGEGKVSRAMAKSGQTDFFDLAKNPALLKQETRHYVPKFLAVLKIFQNLETLGFRPVNWQAGPTMKEVPVPGGTDLLAMAQAVGMDWERFHEANAGFRRQVSAPGRESTVYVPQAKYELAMAFLKDPGSRPPAGYQTYLAQSGETWWSVSRRTGIPVAALREFNAQAPDTLSSGVAIRIPASGSSKEAGLLAEFDGTGGPAEKSRAAAKHRVRKGESLQAIAARYGVSLGELASANRLRTTSKVSIGRWLTIPDGGDVQVARSPALPKEVRQLASAESAGSHTIQKGDTVSAISSRYGVTPKELMAANGIDSPNTLTIGKVLVIPGSETKSAQALVAKKSAASYVVKKGDSLHAIARRFSLDPRTLLAANSLPAPDRLQAGMVLTIPGSGPTQAKPVTPTQAKPAAPTPKPFQVAQFTPAPKAAPTPAQAAPKPLPSSALPNPAPTPTTTTAKAPSPAAPVRTAAKSPAMAAPAVSAPAPSAAKSAQNNVNYKVTQGETVWGIAKKFNVEPKALMSTNNLRDASTLRAGDSLTIPRP
ncbi:LysM peptidoglycan-binding domain-containing protein [Desulfolutivibrio sulfoxidireducens]|uniref:LysM peptidoglycan-binding domain-containing protein n=1 Tax=Desulfolutivibrio sulfoxidireducens TaxID=2773299 RepID=UPI00159D0103|nr:LysM peptidoglycan-binding domain-containing protein [Desulfolutivibrio sulfoxidireducens]QLA16580.1 LysM peptidoglycan-binding domain-containing protein [Desulfolutivibrio sulfoxidireducens]